MKAFFIMIFVLTICQSCITPKSTIYLQADSYPMNVKSSIPFEPTIKCDNVLNILVSSESPQAAQDFNLIIASRNISSSSSAFTQLSNVTYLVDNFGFIDFPVVGKIKVDGLKKSELEILLKDKLEKYIDNPVLFVRILNYRYYVTGEVNRPGEQQLDGGERVTLMEALSKAGDLSINGNRKKIKIIRQEKDFTSINIVDITKPDFLNSEFYYLQQNDVVYVEPNKAKITTSGISPIATTFSIVASAITLFLLIDRL